MSYVTIESVKYAINCYIEDRLNMTRIDIINFLQNTLNYVDPVIYRESCKFIYKKQLEILASRGDFDVAEIFSKVIEDSQNDFKKMDEDIDLVSSKLKTTPLQYVRNSTETMEESSDEGDSIYSQRIDDEISIDETNTYPDKIYNQDNNREQLTITSSIEEVQYIVAIPEIAAIEDKVQDSKGIEIEKKDTLVYSNKTYLEAVIKHSELCSDIKFPESEDIPSKITLQGESFDRDVKTKLKEIEELGKEEERVFVINRPKNPAVFRTHDGSRIEIPILEPSQIHPFINLFAKRFNLDPSFNDYRTEFANTRLKAAYEAMKYLNVNQTLIDSLLKQLD